MCVFEFECEGMGVGKCLYDTKEVENPAMFKRLPVALHLPRDTHARKNWARRPSDAVLPPTAKHLPHAAKSRAAMSKEWEKIGSGRILGCEGSPRRKRLFSLRPYSVVTG